MEDAARERRTDVREMSSEELDKLWEQAKLDS
jgi:uncharacterized protein YabN with tetrapyrrole methylase and pyrophosphatase domain